MRADARRQCMHMIQQQNGFVRPLVSEAAGAQLRWDRLGSATWPDGVASFPRGPDEPGVYLVKVAQAVEGCSQQRQLRERSTFTE